VTDTPPRLAALDTKIRRRLAYLDHMERNDMTEAPAYPLLGDAAPAGQDIDDTAKHMVEMAKATGARVSLTFNGIPLEATPDTTVNDIQVAHYNACVAIEARQMEAKGKIQARRILCEQACQGVPDELLEPGIVSRLLKGTCP
jgi:hypothetical protein